MSIGIGTARASSSSGSGVAMLSRSRIGPDRKRVFDVAVALVLLAAALPLLALIAVAITLDSPGPVFHRARRIGYRGQPLMMLKFRKMHRGAIGVALTAHGDERLTRVGGMLHRTRLDELPQLWDVLRGRMSLIGPRPEDPEFVALHADAYERILAVRPGITGVSQLAFAEEHKILDENDAVGDYVRRILPQKVGLDTLYAEKPRMRVDLAVLGWTVIALLLHKPVAVHRSTLRMTVRKRPRPSHAGDASVAIAEAPPQAYAPLASADANRRAGRRG
jgi:lipopolysaccharide/colanic/teichoic acid biosynthesis glycosyltransferase